jgi:hypothetical protein
MTYCLVLGPLFWECPHPKALPYTKCPLAAADKVEGTKCIYTATNCRGVYESLNVWYA